MTTHDLLENCNKLFNANDKTKSKSEQFNMKKTIRLISSF